MVKGKPLKILFFFLSLSDDFINGFHVLKISVSIIPNRREKKPGKIVEYIFIFYLFVCWWMRFPLFFLHSKRLIRNLLLSLIGNVEMFILATMRIISEAPASAFYSLCVCVSVPSVYFSLFETFIIIIFVFLLRYSVCHLQNTISIINIDFKSLSLQTIRS